MTTPGAKINPALSIYLGNEFAAQLAEAAQQQGFDPKELCKQVLQDAVNGRLPKPDADPDRLQAAEARAGEYLEILSRSQDAWNLVAQRLNVDTALSSEEFTQQVLSRINEMRVLASLGEQAQHPVQTIQVGNTSSRPVGVDYDFHWLGTEQEVRAQFDNLISQGGWPVSITSAADGRFLLLAAWPAG